MFQNINDIIKNHYLASKSLDAYSVTQRLNGEHRKNIITAIVDYCIQNKIRLTTDDFACISSKIKEIFPNESEVSIQTQNKLFQS